MRIYNYYSSFKTLKGHTAILTILLKRVDVIHVVTQDSTVTKRWHVLNCVTSVCALQGTRGRCVWWRLREWSSPWPSPTCPASLNWLPTSLRRWRAAICLLQGEYVFFFSSVMKHNVDFLTLKSFLFCWWRKYNRTNWNLHSLYR